MLKKTLITSGVVASLLMASVAFAQTTTPATTASTVATKITCVGTAVNTREQAIDAAMATFTGATNTAYATRATALKQAYTGTTAKTVATSVKAVWSTFNTSTKNAGKAWQNARNAARAKYRTAAVTCKAPAGTGDDANSSKETSGN